MLTGGLIVPENISLALKCPNGGTISNITIQTLSVTLYSYPSTSFGRCSLNVTSASDYLVLPAPVSFNIKYNLNITSFPSIVYIGQTFTIEFDTVPASTINGTINLSLKCGTTTFQTWFSVPVNVAVNLTASTSLTPQSTCAFQTSATDNNFAFIISSNVTISVIQLQFTSPTIGYTATIPNTLPVLLTSNGVPNDHTNMTAQLLCESQTESLWLITSIQRDYQYSTADYGPCTLSVISAPSYYVLPTPIAFNIKYPLNFTTFPTIVYIGSQINIEIDTIPIANISQTVNLTLVCGISVVQTWSSLPVNNLNSLSVSVELQPQSNCTFQTSANNLYFLQTNSSNVSVSNYQLQFVYPIYNTSFTVPNPVPVLLTVIDFPGVRISYSGKLVCGLETKDFNGCTSIQINLDYFAAQYGSCSVNVTSLPLFYDYPEPVNFFIKFLLNLTVSSTIYIGQEFEIDLQTVPPSAISETVDLALVCAISVEEIWTGLLVNSLHTLNSSNTLQSSSNCIFQTLADNSYFFQSNSSDVNISNLQLEFISPINDSIIIAPNALPVLLKTVEFPDSQAAVTVQLTCGSYYEQFELITSIETNYQYSSIGLGPCSLNVSSASEYLDFPLPVIFNINYNLNFTTLPDEIYIGQQFRIEIDTVPSSNISSNVNLNLVCGSFTVQTWINVAVNEPVNLEAPDALESESGCIFQTPFNDPYFAQTNSSSVSISNVQLQFYLPIENSTIIIPNPFEVLLNSSTVPGLNETLNVSLNCLITSAQTEQLVTTSTTFLFTYDSQLFYGSCFLNVFDAPTYYLIPSPLKFYLKFDLNFFNPPSSLQIEQTFIIQVNSTTSLPENLNTITIGLFCNDTSIQTWQSVPLNQQVSLQLSNEISPADNCLLITLSDNEVFISANTTVNVISAVTSTSTYTFTSTSTESLSTVTDSSPISTTLIPTSTSDTLTPTSTSTESFSTSTYTTVIPTSTSDTLTPTTTSTTTESLSTFTSSSSVFTTVIPTFTSEIPTPTTSGTCTTTPSTTIVPTSAVTISSTSVSTKTETTSPSTATFTNASTSIPLTSEVLTSTQSGTTTSSTSTSTSTSTSASSTVYTESTFTSSLSASSSIATSSASLVTTSTDTQRTLTSTSTTSSLTTSSTNIVTTTIFSSTVTTTRTTSGSRSMSSSSSTASSSSPSSLSSASTSSSSSSGTFTSFSTVLTTFTFTTNRSTATSTLTSSMPKPTSSAINTSTTYVSPPLTSTSLTPFTSDTISSISFTSTSTRTTTTSAFTSNFSITSSTALTSISKTITTSFTSTSLSTSTTSKTSFISTSSSSRTESTSLTSTTRSSTSYTTSCFIGCITSFGTSNRPFSLPPLDTDYNGRNPTINSYPTIQP